MTSKAMFLAKCAKTEFVFAAQAMQIGFDGWLMPVQSRPRVYQGAGNEKYEAIACCLTADCRRLNFFLYLSGLVTSSVSAESNPVQHGSSRRKDEKISDTLRGRNPQTSGSDEIVQVIIQLNSSPTGRLNALLQRNGVHLKEDFRELNSFSVA